MEVIILFPFAKELYSLNMNCSKLMNFCFFYITLEWFGGKLGFKLMWNGFIVTGFVGVTAFGLYT